MNRTKSVLSWAGYLPAELDPDPGHAQGVAISTAGSFESPLPRHKLEVRSVPGKQTHAALCACGWSALAGTAIEARTRWWADHAQVWFTSTDSPQRPDLPCGHLPSVTRPDRDEVASGASLVFLCAWCPEDDIRQASVWEPALSANGVAEWTRSAVPLAQGDAVARVGMDEEAIN